MLPNVLSVGCFRRLNDALPLKIMEHLIFLHQPCIYRAMKNARSFTIFTIFSIIMYCLVVGISAKPKE